jgi:hypothetical protein
MQYSASFGLIALQVRHVGRFSISAMPARITPVLSLNLVRFCSARWSSSAIVFTCSRMLTICISSFSVDIYVLRCGCITDIIRFGCMLV